MNSAVRRFALFFFSFATLAACEDPSDIGLDLQDENLIGTHYTEIDIEAGTVVNTDSILAFRNIPLPIGGYQDGVLGNVKATAFTEVGLSGLDVKFGENPVADSLVLTLDYTPNIYGADNQTPLTLNVHRLTQSFQDKASYFTNSSLAYESNVLGSVTFDPDVLTTKVTKLDSIGPVRIKLNQALAAELLAQSDKDPLKDQFKFVQFFKGIAIVPQNTPREVIAFNPSSTRTNITLYYKNGTDTTRKQHIFYMNGTNIRNFSKIEVNRAGTVLEGAGKRALIPSATTGGETYVQAGTELYTKLVMPQLGKLREELGDIVINRAELIIPVKNGSNNTLRPPSLLALYFSNNNRIKEDQNGNGQLVPRDLPYAIGTNNYPAQLAYNSKKNQYAVNLTAYVQAIVTGKLENSDILIAPALFQSVGTTGATSVTREIFPYRTILSNTAERGMKLRVYYSKLD